MARALAPGASALGRSLQLSCIAKPADGVGRGRVRWQAQELVLGEEGVHRWKGTVYRAQSTEGVKRRASAWS